MLRRFTRSIRKFNIEIPKDPLKGYPNVDPLQQNAIPHSTAEAISNQVVKQLKYLNSFQFRGYSFLKLAGAATAAISALIYLFGDSLKSQVGKTGADMATIALSGDNVKSKAETLSKSVIIEVLSDSATKDQVTIFLEKLSKEKKTQDAVIHLLSQSVQNPQTVELTSNYLKESLKSMYLDKSMHETTAEFVSCVLDKPITKQSTTNLISWSLDQPIIHSSTGRILSDLTREEYIRNSTAELLKWSTLQTLKDEIVKEQAKEFVHDVLKDKTLHVDAGDALWATIKNSVTPSYWK